MAGTVLKLVPLSTFSWSSMAGSTTATVILADYIDLSPWKEAVLHVRVHPGTSIASGASVNFLMRQFDPAFDDPGQLFDLTSGITNGGGVVLNNSTPVPSLQMNTLDPNFGLYGRLFITPSQPASPVSATMVYSVDLVLRTDG